MDITHELELLLDEEERFLKPEKEIKYEIQGPRECECCTPPTKKSCPFKETILKDRVFYLDESLEDISTQMTLSHDAFTAEKDYFYNYSELRGFTRALRGPSGEWKKVVKVNDECKGLKCVSMVIHKGDLLVRHAGLEGQPFVCYDKETLRPKTDGPKFKFPDA